MSNATTTTDGTDLEDLTDEELLERLAACDPEEIPIAEDARRALGQDQDEEESA